MTDDQEFEKYVHDTVGLTPQQTRVFLKISQMAPDLRNVLRGSEVADDIDALLLLSRLSSAQQVVLAAVIRKGLLPKLAVALMSRGDLPAMLDEVLE